MNRELPMSKKLSATEMDLLLHETVSKSGFEKPSQAETSWTEYDFKRATHLSKDQLRILTRTHEQFARALTNELTMRLRVPVQLQVQDLSEITYEDVLDQLPRTTVIQVIDLMPFDGRMLMQFDTHLVFAMLDYFMGGTNQKSYIERELTEIETLLFQSLIGQLCSLYAKAWSPFSEFSARFGALENNPRFVQVATPSDSVLRLRFTCKMEQIETTIQIVIPYILFEEMIPKLSARHFHVQRANSHRDKHYRAQITEHLRNTDAVVSLELGSTQISLHEVIDLQVGDVIPLQHPIDAPLLLHMEGTPIATGHIGIMHRNYAAKIVELWKEDNEKHD